MSERQSLLAAIAETPDDDAVRLVFADWLDDHGESDRAEFIRHQVEAMRRPTWCPERSWLLWRADRLLEAHPEWRAGFPVLEGVTWGRFERGFLAEAVVADFDALRRQGDAIGQVGTVNVVAVIRARRNYPTPSLPVLPWLRALHLDGWRVSVLGEMLYSDGCTRLAQSPLLSTLTVLRLDHHWPAEVGLGALARSPHVPNLRGLSVVDDHASGSGWTELLGSDKVKDLRWLCTRHRGLSISPGFRLEMAQRFGDASNLSNLESLDVSRRCLDPDSLRWVFASPHFAGLRELSIRSALLAPEQMLAFREPSVRSRLAALDVSANHFRREGLTHLLSAPCLALVERINLADCRLLGPDGELLTKASWRTSVTALALSRNRLHAAGLRRLLAADWPRLRELHLDATGLKPAAIDALVAWSGLPNLRTLSLAGNNLGDAVESRLRDAGLPSDARLVLSAAG